MNSPVARVPTLLKLFRRVSPLAFAALLASAAEPTPTQRTAATTNTIYPTIPSGCATPNVNGTNYCLRGNNWSLPLYGTNGAYCRAVAAP